jgi:hypothetical protein
MTSGRTAHVCLCGWGALDHRLAMPAAKDRAGDDADCGVLAHLYHIEPSKSIPPASPVS